MRSYSVSVSCERRHPPTQHLRNTERTSVKRHPRRRVHHTKSAMPSIFQASFYLAVATVWLAMAAPAAAACNGKDAVLLSVYNEVCWNDELAGTRSTCIANLDSLIPDDTWSTASCKACFGFGQSNSQELDMMSVAQGCFDSAPLAKKGTCDTDQEHLAETLGTGLAAYTSSCDGSTLTADGQDSSCSRLRNEIMANILIMDLKCAGCVGNSYIRSPTASSYHFEDSGEHATSLCKSYTCSPPDHIPAGHEVQATHVTSHNFEVKVSCKDGYIGDPKAVQCSGTAPGCVVYKHVGCVVYGGGSYSVSGCVGKAPAKIAGAPEVMPVH